MGQAFDREGNVLGEAFGATRREVLDALELKHKDAAEIRIRSIEDTIRSVEPAGGASAEMPRYKCSKEVWALQIARITHEGDGTAVLHWTNQVYDPIHVSATYMQKHQPTPGGYYVVYADGYKSFSPAFAFEAGYSLI